MRNRHLRLLPPLPAWQQWPRGYEPSVEELESLTEEEYNAWAEQEFGVIDTSRHPSNV